VGNVLVIGPEGEKEVLVEKSPKKTTGGERFDNRAKATALSAD
jgi:hypothetical protein